jgi:DHA2 family methylenomycin A resistance protein-like MFS transporter
VFGALIAGPDFAAATRGIETALAIATFLLLLGALLAWRCIKPPLSTQGESLCRT